MTLVAFPGSPLSFVGPGFSDSSIISSSSTTLDATGESVVFIGRMITSDGGSHTIDTTGSSSIGWRTGNVTFADGGTTVKVGIAAVLTTAGPPGRAANAADVITFDVSKTMTGGGGGITTNAWQTHVPDAGTKTIANGDLVAIGVQMTARGGVADSVTVTHQTLSLVNHGVQITTFLAAAYAAGIGLPNAFVTFSDGAFGYIAGGQVFSVLTARTWNSTAGTKEYGQLFNLPFPMKVYGIWGFIDPDGDHDVVLYSDPLSASPVPERTVSVDANTTASAAGRRFIQWFATPYTTTANQSIVAALKPGTSNISTYYKTLNSAAHRVSDPWGTSGYGVSRASAAFSDANSSLDHYYVGLILGAFDDGTSTGGGISRARGAAGF